MMELQDFVNRNNLYHMDIVQKMEEFKDNEDVLVALRNFNSDCSEAFGGYWEQNEVEFINEDYFEEYAWELLHDLGLVSEEMLGYIDIARFATDLKMDFYPVDLDRKTFWGRY